MESTNLNADSDYIDNIEGVASQRPENSDPIISTGDAALPASNEEEKIISASEKVEKIFAQQVSSETLGETEIVQSEKTKEADPVSRQPVQDPALVAETFISTEINGPAQTGSDVHVMEEASVITPVLMSSVNVSNENSTISQAANPDNAVSKEVETAQTAVVNDHKEATNEKKSTETENGQPEIKNDDNAVITSRIVEDPGAVLLFSEAEELFAHVNLGDEHGKEYHPTDQIVITQGESGLKVAVQVTSNPETIIVNKTVFQGPEGDQQIAFTIIESKIPFKSFIPKLIGKAGPCLQSKVTIIPGSRIPLSKQRISMLGKADNILAIAVSNQVSHPKRPRTVKFKHPQEVGKKEPKQPESVNLLLTTKGVFTQLPSDDGTVNIWVQDKDSDNTMGPIFPSLDSRPISRGACQKFLKSAGKERAPDPIFSIHSQPLPQLRKSTPPSLITADKNHRSKLIREIKIRRYLDSSSTSFQGRLGQLQGMQHRLIKTKDFLSIYETVKTDRILPSIVPLAESKTKPELPFTLTALPVNKCKQKPKWVSTPRLIRTPNSRSSSLFEKFPSKSLDEKSEIRVDALGIV